jgi:hypothetical protein
MERKIIYNLEKSTNGFEFNPETFKYEPINKNANVRILEEANDLRYAGYGIQAIYAISLCFPDHHIIKTMRNANEESLKKVEAWVNKVLKKNKYKQVDFNKDLKQTNFHQEFIINNIEKEDV